MEAGVGEAVRAGAAGVVERAARVATPGELLGQVFCLDDLETDRVPLSKVSTATDSGAPPDARSSLSLLIASRYRCGRSAPRAARQTGQHDPGAIECASDVGDLQERGVALRGNPPESGQAAVDEAQLALRGSQARRRGVEPRLERRQAGEVDPATAARAGGRHRSPGRTPRGALQSCARRDPRPSADGPDRQPLRPRRGHGEPAPPASAVTRTPQPRRAGRRTTGPSVPWPGPPPRARPRRG